MKQRISQLEFDQDAIQGKADADQVVLEDNQRELASLRSREEELAKELSSLQEEKRATKDAFLQADRKFELLKEQASSKLEEANNVCDGYEAQIAELKSQLEREQRNSKLLEESVEEARTEAQQVEEAKRVAVAAAESAQGEKGALEGRVAELAETVETLIKEKEAAERATKVARIEVESANDDIKKLRSELNNCKVDLQEARDAAGGGNAISPASHSTAITELKQQNEALQEQLDAAQAAGLSGGGGDDAVIIGELNTQLEEANQALEAKVKENEELQKVCNELFQLVEQKEAGAAE